LEWGELGARGPGGIVLKTISSRTAVLVAAAVLVAGPAHAAIIVTLDSITPFGAYFDYRYSITATSTDLIMPEETGNGSYFTLYDIPGLITAERISADWQPSGGLTPPGVSPADDPSLSNLRFYYRGETRISGPTTPVLVGLLRSSYGTSALGTYAWFDYAVDPLYPDSRIPTSGLGQVAIPSVTGGGGNGNGGTDPTRVPEPATASLLAVALAFLTVFVRRRVRSLPALAPRMRPAN
jgi:hypothetical protein